MSSSSAVLTSLVLGHPRIKAAQHVALISLPARLPLSTFDYAMKMWIALVLLLGLSAHDAQAQQSNNTSAAPFSERYKVVWGQQHVHEQMNGQSMQMVLDNSSGSAFESYDKYMFGYISMRMKLVPNNSAGVVTTFYLSSKTDTHDELDLEFLGNVSGQPYVLHTNIFVDGVGGRETRIFLWFDPAEDFHTYAFLWNRHQIVFFVDSIPIRVLKYTPSTIYPQQPMYVYGSIWDASEWATRGGLDKIDWASAPFVSEFGYYGLDSCKWKDPYPPCVSETWQHWWDQPAAWTLSASQRASYMWVQKNFLVYDYCTDTKRYPTPPAECLLAL